MEIGLAAAGTAASTAAGMVTRKLASEISRTVDKSVVIYVNNELNRVLEYPTVYTLNGELKTVAADIKPKEQAMVIFQKTPLSPTGIVGAISYTIRGTPLKAVVYFENPSLGKKMFGVRWYDAEAEIEISDLKAWKRESSNLRPATDMWEVGDKMGNREKESEDFIVKVFMTNSSHAQINITLAEIDPDSDDDDLTDSDEGENSDDWENSAVDDNEDHYYQDNNVDNDFYDDHDRDLFGYDYLDGDNGSNHEYYY